MCGSYLRNTISFPDLNKLSNKDNCITMSKREHLTGSSPSCKKLCDAKDNESDDDIFASPDLSHVQLLPASKSPVLLDSFSPRLFTHSSENNFSLPIFTPESHSNVDEDLLTPAGCNTSANEVFEFTPIQDVIDSPKEMIEKSKGQWGLETTVEAILGDNELMHAIIIQLNTKSHEELKSSLSHSQLSSDKKKRDRNYLLTLTPRSLCEEFQENAPAAFNLIVYGLLGVKDLQTLYDDSNILNRVALIYSVVANYINRKATGYAMARTAAARDGGLREDSLKLFVDFCNPTTMQRYDRNVLANDWDKDLNTALEIEKNHFQELHSGELSVASYQNEASRMIIRTRKV